MVPITGQPIPSINTAVSGRPFFHHTQQLIDDRNANAIQIPGGTCSLLGILKSCFKCCATTVNQHLTNELTRMEETIQIQNTQLRLLNHLLERSQTLSNKHNIDRRRTHSRRDLMNIAHPTSSVDSATSRTPLHETHQILRDRSKSHDEFDL